MKLQDRVAKLETAFEPEAPPVVVIDKLCGETDEDAISRHEAENGPIYDPRGSVLRVLIEHF